MHRWALSALLLPGSLACTGTVSLPTGPSDGPASGPERPGAPGTPGEPSDPGPAPRPPVCEAGEPPIVPRVERLSFERYDRAVESWFGLDLELSTSFGPETQGISGLLWSGLRDAAARVGERVAADRLSALPCQDDNAGCAEAIIRQVGRRLYRRPLTETEVGRYAALWADRALLTPNDTFAEGVALLVEAMMSSPYTLHRVERSTAVQDGRIALDGFERATRLAFGLWDAPPDDALLDAAAAGELATAEGLAAQVERMLSRPEGRTRSRAMVRRLARDWMGMEGAYAQFWNNTNRDPELFPEFEPGIDASFREEMLRFVDGVVFAQEGSFQDLFGSPMTWVNGQLAPIYGLDAGDGGWRSVELDPSERPGLLTRAGFNGTHGRFGRGSLIFRGAFVLTKLLCRELGAPPAGADATPLPNDAELLTTRDRVEAMTAGPACAGCHTTLINPAGFALEAFDGIGKYRASENGYPVDTSGSLRIDGELVSFSDAAGYSAAIGGAEEAHRCFLDRLGESTLGSPSCAEQDLVARMMAGAPLLEVIQDYVTRPTFLDRNLQEVP